MISQLNFTFGSSSLLRDIAKKYPDRPFKLFVSSGENAQHALFDLSGKENIFSSPIRLKVIKSAGADDLRGIVYYQSFKLSTDDEQIMRKKVTDLINDSQNVKGLNSILMCERVGHSQLTILISTWNSQKDLDQWLDSNEYAPLLEFSARGLQNTYFSEKYTLA